LINELQHTSQNSFPTHLLKAPTNLENFFSQNGTWEFRVGEVKHIYEASASRAASSSAYTSFEGTSPLDAYILAS